MSLEARLRERIQREGPISFYEWMKSALYDERDGYYSGARQRQGRTGDYRTAPETSPLFAATFAGYFARLFAELGSPEQFTILEMGAGTGEFALRVLATLKAEHPQVFDTTRYVVEEVSLPSRERCALRLREFGNRVSLRTPGGEAGGKITGVIFSNELIDAFPVNRVVMRQGRLRQLFVGVDRSQFVWLERKLEKPIAAYCDRVDLNLREGQIVEINLDAEAFIERAAASLGRGHVVTVDYGAERTELLNSLERHRGTLRGFRSHQFAGDVLASPGEQDLTTTIDWTQIREAGKRCGLRTVRFDRLDQFLIAEGLLDRIAAITQRVTDTAEALRLTTGARELIMPNGMAASFQVLVQEKPNS